MTGIEFSRPIIVRLGTGYHCEVRDLMDAIRFLDEQPAAIRDEAFQAAHDACRDGLRNALSADEARDILCAFARRRDLLVAELGPAPLEDGDKLIGSTLASRRPSAPGVGMPL